VTALIASLAVARPEGLAIALVHTLFNVTAVALIFPVKRIRLVPVRLAEGLADLAIKRHTVVLAYGVSIFIILPLLGLFLIQ
jgi:solute carrier family 34 (sodium-dependent phosphate cotransporter)